MIPPIQGKTTHQVYSESPPLRRQRSDESTLSSYSRCSCLCAPLRFFYRVYACIKNWIVHKFETLMDKFSPTTEEFLMFEGILEGGVRGTFLLFYDRDHGKKTLKETVKNCHDLFDQLGKKWFPSMKGVFFMRLNLMKIAMRIHAMFGNKKELKSCRKAIQSIGGEVPEHLEKLIQYYSLIDMDDWKFETSMKAINFFTQSAAKYFTK